MPHTSRKMPLRPVQIFPFLFLFLLLFSTPSYCQETNSFQKYIKNQQIGKTVREVDADSTIFETTYLGQLKMKESSVHSAFVNYHVIRQFYSVQAAISRHGHSQLIFTNESGERIKIYTFDLPEELPTGIRDNGLVFSDGIIRYVSLPPLFCIPNGTCFE